MSGHDKEGSEKGIVRRAKKHWRDVIRTVHERKKKRTVHDLIYNLRTLLVLLSEEH